MTKVNWGILSVAAIAMNRVIPAMKLAPNLNILGISSRDEKKARDAADKVGIERSYGSYEAMLADPDIEAVYIGLPNNMHVEWCIKAMEAGKHVLCEKPITMNAKEAEMLVPVRNKTGKLMEEAFSMRNHPQWAALRQVIESGEIGDIRSAHSTMCIANDDPNNIRNRPEVGGGALLDAGAYAIAGCRLAFNDEPTHAIGLFNKHPQFGTDATVSAILKFPKGQATFTVSMEAGPRIGGAHQTFNGMTERGWYRLDYPYAHGIPVVSHLYVGDEASFGGYERRSLAFNPMNQYTAQAERFSRLVRGEKAQAFPIEWSIANMRVIDAVARSRDSGVFEKV